MRRATLLIALVALLASAAVALGGGKAGPPKRAIVTSQGLSARGVLGSYCAVNTDDSGCGDGAYPLPVHSYLPLVAGSKVRVNVRQRGKGLNAYLVHVEGDQMHDAGGAIVTKPVAHTHHRIWRLHIPSDLGDANVLNLEAAFPGAGDANWWVGVKPVEQWP